jgi:hypothetical protein
MVLSLVKHRDNITFTLISPWSRVFIGKLVVTQVISFASSVHAK